MFDDWADRSRRLVVLKSSMTGLHLIPLFILVEIEQVFLCFVTSDNMMNKSFQMTDTVFGIDQVNIGTMNILKLDINAGKSHIKRSI